MKKEILMTFVVLCISFHSYAQTGEWIKDINTGCKVWNPFPAPNETITWSGQCIDGFAHGKGILQWYLNGVENGKYEGTYMYGKRNGQGTEILVNGEKYVGEWKDDKRNGQGSYTWPNEGKYVGEWKDGKRNGQGTLMYSDGRKYVGEWHSDWKDGQGIETYASGQQQSGLWVRDRFSYVQDNHFLVIYFDNKNNALGWCQGIDQNKVNNCALNECIQYGGSKSASECIYSENVTDLFVAVALVDENRYYFNFGASNTSLKDAEQDALNKLNKTNGTILSSWNANIETSGGYKFGSNSYTYNNNKKNSNLDNFLDGAQQSLDDFNTQRGHSELTSDNILNQSGNNNYESESNTNSSDIVRKPIWKCGPGIYAFNTGKQYQDGKGYQEKDGYVTSGGLAETAYLPILGNSLATLPFNGYISINIENGGVESAIGLAENRVLITLGGRSIEFQKWHNIGFKDGKVAWGYINETTTINGITYYPGQPLIFRKDGSVVGFDYKGNPPDNMY
jgi:hypothetical protein